MPNITTAQAMAIPDKVLIVIPGATLTLERHSLRYPSHYKVIQVESRLPLAQNLQGQNFLIGNAPEDWGYHETLKFHEALQVAVNRLPSRHPVPTTNN
jgi:hypothetical protein